MCQTGGAKQNKVCASQYAPEVLIPTTMTGFRLFSAPLHPIMWFVVLCNTFRPHDCHKPYTIVFICSISPWLLRNEHYDFSSARSVRAAYESDVPSLSLLLSAALVSQRAL